MKESCRLWISASLYVLLGLLGLARGFHNNEFEWIIIGLVFIFCTISISITNLVRSYSKFKRCIEVAFSIASFGAIICGYFISGSQLLMVFAAAIISFLALGFILSYLVPKIRNGKIPLKKSHSSN